MHSDIVAVLKEVRQTIKESEQLAQRLRILAKKLEKLVGKTWGAL